MSRERIITSPQNKWYKLWSSLHDRKGIEKNQLCMLSGKKWVDDCIADERLRDRISALVLSDEMQSSINQFSADFPVFSLSGSLFKKLDCFGTHQPLLILKCPEIKKIPAIQSEHFWEGLSLMLPLQNPDNIGAVIRSAAAFGVKRIILTKSAAHPLLPKALRAGSLYGYKMELYQCEKVEDALSWDTQVFGLDARGSDISKQKFSKRCLFVIGLEGSGVPEELRSRIDLLKIPISNYVESLNATVATSIALYAWSHSGRS